MLCCNTFVTKTWRHDIVYFVLLWLQYCTQVKWMCCPWVFTASPPPPCTCDDWGLMPGQYSRITSSVFIWAFSTVLTLCLWHLHKSLRCLVAHIVNTTWTMWMTSDLYVAPRVNYHVILLWIGSHSFHAVPLSIFRQPVSKLLPRARLGAVEHNDVLALVTKRQKKCWETQTEEIFCHLNIRI